MASVSGDQAAVKAGLTLPWNNGRLEGHVNRLNLLKRQGYGRASFEVLLHRVLNRPEWPQQVVSTHLRMRTRTPQESEQARAPLRAQLVID